MSDEDGEADSSRTALAVGMVLVLVGVGLASASLLSAADAMAAADRGVPTEGTVLETTVETVETIETDTDGERQRETDYRAQVTYEYAVDGATYTSSTLVVPPLVTDTTGRAFDESGDARDFLSDYEPGEAVTVYYMPDDPGSSYLLEPDYHPLEFLLPVVFGAVFALPGTLLLLWTLGLVGDRSAAN